MVLREVVSFLARFEYLPNNPKSSFGGKVHTKIALFSSRSTLLIMYEKHDYASWSILSLSYLIIHLLLLDNFIVPITTFSEK